mmetsp:Transcript_18836/g.45355  ORF Transcript_18836/g.45355 Transcript_18836/m.45355 type:complete len:235 (-) Transcript_18836:728-1432(-)
MHHAVTHEVELVIRQLHWLTALGQLCHGRRQILVDGHVGREDGRDAPLPELLVLWEGQEGEEVAARQRQQLEQTRRVVRLEHRTVVVADRQWVSGLDQEIIVRPKMANIVAKRRNKAPHSPQIPQHVGHRRRAVGVRVRHGLDQPLLAHFGTVRRRLQPHTARTVLTHQSRHMHHRETMVEVVVGVGEVVAADLSHEVAKEHLVEVEQVEEVEFCEDSLDQDDELAFGELEGVE